ncbi:hypothetical protein SNOG_09316 [Parastagonospora nodorum SN15]|uniref:Uncharacterized protein n=1 Tax=Phaeosphaeria nodorum (strain SN15 / ATCC MYA-4574 / FGSC 10173) TaxID=321614 RepID=Q0UFZ8_PHANO|nr:hypothetical protein SNOG_09316 [Parastagonospora nodorum SN15]EAT83508.1 hypothetical protein SNOG_09316 [Parastagonospora nodorum SN15]
MAKGERDKTVKCQKSMVDRRALSVQKVVNLRCGARASGHSEQKAGINQSQTLAAMQGRSGGARASPPIKTPALDASFTSLSKLASFFDHFPGTSPVPALKPLELASCSHSKIADCAIRRLSSTPSSDGLLFACSPSQTQSTQGSHSQAPAPRET